MIGLTKRKKSERIKVITWEGHMVGGLGALLFLVVLGWLAWKFLVPAVKVGCAIIFYATLGLFTLIVLVFMLGIIQL